MIRTIIAVCLAFPAIAAPPPNANPDSAMSGWYQSLRSPETGAQCCSSADCRNVEYRIRGDHYEAFMDKPTFGGDAPDAWIRVPDGVVIRRDNPTGGAVACWWGSAIKCFVPGGGT